MYKNAGLLGKKRRPIHYVVNNKGGAGKTQIAPKGAKMKVVDRRMKADLRAKGRGTKGKPKAGGGRGGRKGGSAAAGGGGKRGKR